MKLTTRQDIEAPIEVVFAAVTDFDNFERQGLRRGAEIARQDPGGAPGVGSRWTIRAPFRGRSRDFAATISHYEPPIALAVDTATSGLDGLVLAELVALSPRRTRLQFAVELKPSSLSGRILVQSLRFARATLRARMDSRAQQFARTVEDRHARG